jgi:dipeptidyl-peptidase III
LRGWLSYAAQFLGNAGNFKSFGDSKFIPRISKDKVGALAEAAGPDASKLYHSVKDDLYESTSTAQMHLGYPDKGHVSTYYPHSPDITREDIEYTSNFIKEKQLMPENTRLRKTADGDYDLLIASAVTNPTHHDVKETEWTLDGPYKGKKLRLVYGDYQTEMAKISENLAHAKACALNPTEEKMQAEYVTSFHDGSMLAHKESQRYWIQDKGPMVETNIGFIETYRDPHGIRGEWEGEFGRTGSCLMRLLTFTQVLRLW